MITSTLLLLTEPLMIFSDFFFSSFLQSFLCVLPLEARDFLKEMGDFLSDLLLLLESEEYLAASLGLFFSSSSSLARASISASLKSRI